MKLIAIGGGGFTAESDPLLDDLVLDHAKGPETRFGFITTASDHDAIRLERFERLMVPRVRTAEHLAPSADAAALAQWLTRLDLLYIGGGDTERLQTVWSERGYWPVLKTAIEKGLCIAGVSAGAVIWFEAALVRDRLQQLQFIKGVGLIEGSVCVHFSSEADRAAPFCQAVKAQKIPEGIAIDDGVAVIVQPGAPLCTISARSGHQAYRVYASGLLPLTRVNG